MWWVSSPFTETARPASVPHPSRQRRASVPTRVPTSRPRAPQSRTRSGTSTADQNAPERGSGAAIRVQRWHLSPTRGPRMAAGCRRSAGGRRFMVGYRRISIVAPAVPMRLPVGAASRCPAALARLVPGRRHARPNLPALHTLPRAFASPRNARASAAYFVLPGNRRGAMGVGNAPISSLSPLGLSASGAHIRGNI